MSEKPKPLMKLARSQMRPVVLRLYREQGSVCAVCKEPIDFTIKGEGVLDHDHATGEVRGTLHRWCNGQLGKVEGAAIRAKRSGDHKTWLANAVEFINNAKSGLMYPSHKTETEKRAAKALAERKRRATIKAGEAMKAMKAKRGTDAT